MYQLYKQDDQQDRSAEECLEDDSEAVLKDLEDMSYAAQLYEIPVTMLRDFINKNK